MYRSQAQPLHESTISRTQSNLKGEQISQNNSFIDTALHQIDYHKIQYIISALQALIANKGSAKLAKIAKQAQIIDGQNKTTQVKQQGKMVIFLLPQNKNILKCFQEITGTKLTVHQVSSNIQACWQLAPTKIILKSSQNKILRNQNEIQSKKSKQLKIQNKILTQSILESQKQNQSGLANQLIQRSTRKMSKNLDQKAQALINQDAQNIDPNMKNRHTLILNHEISYLDSVVDEVPADQTNKSILQQAGILDNISLQEKKEKIQQNNGDALAILPNVQKKQYKKLQMEQAPKQTYTEQSKQKINSKTQNAPKQQPKSGQNLNQRKSDKQKKYRQKFIFCVSQVRKQQLKSQQWFKLLLKLSYAQTQITYLAQQFDWSLKFLQGNTQIGEEMFSCRTEVVVSTNELLKKFSGQCKGARNKKQARHHASILCLANIYAGIKGIYQNFKTIKSQNPSLKQKEKQDNSQILDEWLEENKNVEITQIDIDENKKNLDYKPTIDEYINRLKSWKHQLYYFIGQNNKMFMPPRWAPALRENLRGLWNAECSIKYQIQGRMYEYKHSNAGKSQKQSEQLVSKKMLRQIYEDFPGLYNKFKKIKYSRGFQ